MMKFICSIEQSSRVYIRVSEMIEPHTNSLNRMVTIYNREEDIFFCERIQQPCLPTRK